MNVVIEDENISFDVIRRRVDFPILSQNIHGKPLVYLDNAATTQKPNQVLAAMNAYYQVNNANIHRGVHTLSVRATQEFEQARKTLQHFINAKHDHEIIFTKGTTDGINLVASTFGRSQLKAGDEILVSHMEHHSNIVPWQLICEQVGAILKVIPMNDAGDLDFNAYQGLLSSRTKMVAMAHVSNAIGTINPVKQFIEEAHQHAIPVLIDGAQAVPHMMVDVQELDCDFYVFSGHKMYGPTGIGVLYGKTKWLEKLPPYQGGGDMITQVSFEKTEFNKLPYKFEAGTPNIAAVIGFASAVHYMNTIGLAAINAHEASLLDYATCALEEIAGLEIIGKANQKAAVISFVMKDIHPHDIGTVLDHEGVAIRAGHHCAMPLMSRYNLPATARASFALYNTMHEIDGLVAALHKLQRLFE